MAATAAWWQPRLHDGSMRYSEDDLHNNCLYYQTVLILCAQAIQEQMKLHGQEPVSFQDVKDEIFDMVKPADPLKLTLQDLINRWAPYLGHFFRGMTFCHALFPLDILCCL